MFRASRTLRGGIAPALVWTRQLASLTLGGVRNAGFASEVRIAATRHLPAAGVRSRIGHDVRSAPGTGRVSRATAGGLARAGPGSGLAECVRGRGNLPDAEAGLRRALADARARREQDVEARAEHGIGVVLCQMGQPAEAIPHTWRAFELYEDKASQLRALNDIGIMLLMVGNSAGAERALCEVVRRGATPESTSNAMIELMHTASFRRDHVGFARWRERCEERLSDMPPNFRADFYLKQGIGQARFGRYRRAKAVMKEALAIAGAAGLHEVEFRIERILAGLGDCEQAMAREAQPAAEPALQSDELREVSESLARLVG